MLVLVGRLVTRVDQRVLLAFGVLMNGLATLLMSHVTVASDFWSLALPRLVQGIGMGFIFVPLQMLALASIPMGQLPNATALFNVVRNVGGSVGVAISTALLSRRAQVHQSTLIAHVNPWDPETAERLRLWTDHFLSRGADSATAARQAVAMLYRETQAQSQVLAFIDDFRVLAAMYAVLVVLIVFMHRVRVEPAERTRAAAEPAVPVLAAE
jgi:DHA2 family multidrug resistance protein